VWLLPAPSLRTPHRHHHHHHHHCVHTPQTHHTHTTHTQHTHTTHTTHRKHTTPHNTTHTTHTITTTTTCFPTRARVRCDLNWPVKIPCSETSTPYSRVCPRELRNSQHPPHLFSHKSFVVLSRVPQNAQKQPDPLHRFLVSTGQLGSRAQKSPRRTLACAPESSETATSSASFPHYASAKTGQSGSRARKPPRRTLACAPESSETAISSTSLFPQEREYAAASTGELRSRAQKSPHRTFTCAPERSETARPRHRFLEELVWPVRIPRSEISTPFACAPESSDTAIASTSFPTRARVRCSLNWPVGSSETGHSPPDSAPAPPNCYPGAIRWIRWSWSP